LAITTSLRTALDQRFSTWAGEETVFAREVIEAALAHVIGNKVEAAYQRGDRFEKRRALMNEWADLRSSITTMKEEVREVRQDVHEATR
jgi:hypothetical protein